MNLKKSLVYIIAAAAAILIALFLINGLVAEKKAEAIDPAAEEPAAVEMEGIIVAASDIPAGAKITEDMIKTQQYPADTISTDTFRFADEIVGAKAIVDITAGQILNSRMIRSVNEDEDSLGYEVPDGFVAVSVSVHDIEGVSGYLVKGDTVNILADAMAIKAAMDGEVFWADDPNPVTQAYLAKNVTILSVGDKYYDVITMGEKIIDSELSDTDHNDDENTSVDGRYQYDSVVLCLDDYTARIVVEVLKTSKLFLALQHRAADEEIVIQRPYLPGVAQSFESFLPRNSNPPAAPTAANNQAWHGNTYSANPVPSPTPSPTTVIYPWQSVVK